MIRNRSTLKGYFTTGAQPTQDQFGDLIDSALMIGEATTGINDSGNLLSGTVVFVVTGSNTVTKTTLGNLYDAIGIKENTYTIVSSPSNPNQKPPGLILQDDSLIGQTLMAVLTLSGVPLQWESSSIVFDTESGEIDFTAYEGGPLTLGTIITMQYRKTI